jgi:phosphate starvation-inducible PhoH-like protein
LPSTREIHLLPENNLSLIALCGPHNSHLRYIEQTLEVTLYNRGHYFYIQGDEENVTLAQSTLNALYQFILKQKKPTLDLHHLKKHLDKHYHLISTMTENTSSLAKTRALQTPRKRIQPHSTNQAIYLERIEQFDINFAIGPAGTGKTYLAVASAVSALERQQISRIILVRPAVEAGEKLGFLPGDFAQKLDPYFRPLYDALYEVLGFKQTMRFIETHVIEIAPLAYMRGRTLNDAFVLLDEAQNTTPEQMKMFLTRIGLHSKMVISGDITQTDLPKPTISGLRHCIKFLKKIEGVGFTYFDTQDIVRHSLVQTILHAYDENESQ